MSRISALEALPSELMDEVAGYLSSWSCGNLRQASRRLYFETDYTFLKHCTHVKVDFHRARMAQFFATCQNVGMAKAVKTLTIVVLDNAMKHRFSESDRQNKSARKAARLAGSFQHRVNLAIQAATTTTCCTSGACGKLLAGSLRLLVNITEVRIVGDYLDIAHVKCDGMLAYPCRSRPLRHRALPTILRAIKLSGITPPRLTMAEFGRGGIPYETSPRCPNIGTGIVPELDDAALEHVRELSLSFGERRLGKHVCRDDFYTLRHSLSLAPALTMLELRGPHPGFITNAFLQLPDAPLHFPALHTLRLADDEDVWVHWLQQLLTELVPQLEELSLVGLRLTTDNDRWVDVLHVIRASAERRPLQRFTFARNSHAHLNPAAPHFITHALTVYDATGPRRSSGRVRAVDLGPWATPQLRHVVFDDVDDWVALFHTNDDDGEVFGDVVARLGVVAAIDAFALGAYDSSSELDWNLVWQLI